MTGWFRHYIGLSTDPKFGGVARRCQQPKTAVLGVWMYLLESAAEHFGPTYAWDADAAGEALDLSSRAAQDIHDALESKGLLAGGEIAKWNKRQFKSDHSTNRVQAWRERRANLRLVSNVAETLPQQQEDVAPPSKVKPRATPRNVSETLPAVSPTLPQRHVTPPESDTDTESEKRESVSGGSGGGAGGGDRAPPKREPAVYARRCPERWRPAPADLETGRAEGFTDAEMARELAKFRDHQFKTAHTSWSAAFRNWLRTEADRRRERGGRGFSGLTLPERMDAEDARATQEALAILAARDRG